MSKSIRVNLSLPSVLFERYSKYAELNGMTLPSVLVHFLGVQSSFVAKAISTIQYAPRGSSRAEQVLTGLPEPQVVVGSQPQRPAGMPRAEWRRQSKALKKLSLDGSII